MLPAMLQLILPMQGQAAAPQWSVDPSVPGADIPAAGASLFDVVTTTQGRQSIAFPFEKLIARFEAAAGCGVRPACTRAILLPLGRSLQRAAASPDFFAHPRVVAAVVDDGRGPLLLKDRLYVGYQDKAGVIEVISYNEALGRFEFQIVRNYQAGQTPQVSYARRAVCVSCHQNHGPIFSRQVWLETNANPQIAARLAEHGTAFHGVAAGGALDIANAIDDATDRANRLALVQQLWRRGCGDGTAGDRCRRGVFIASMQFRLTGGRAYDVAGNFQRDVVDRLQANARLQWPAGIAIPDADIVNRDPLAVPEQGDPLALVHVPARFDPLVPRAPVEIVAAEGRVLADELVRGIAGFMSSAQLEELDRVLKRNAEEFQVRDFEAPCAISAISDQVAFDCSIKPPSVIAADPSGLQLSGTLGRTEGVLDNIEAYGNAPIRHLRIRSVARRADAAGRSVSFEVHDRGRTARLPDGNAISSIILKWPAPRGEPPAQPDGRSTAPDRRLSGTATLKIREDFGLAASFLSLTSDPIRSSSVDELIANMRGLEAKPCCGDAQPFPLLATHPRDETNVAPPAAVFEPECGNCHHTAEITPPNFLAGDAKRVSDALDSCAARIFVRLAMQDVPAAERDKTPMPPEPVLLPGQRPLAHDARKSASLAAIRRAIEERLRIQYGRVPTAAELLKDGYENLRPCLPASS
jgi:hypothetical protein